jgi:hypothetical protein
VHAEVRVGVPAQADDALVGELGAAGAHTTGCSGTEGDTGAGASTRDSTNPGTGGNGNTDDGDHDSSGP